MHWTVWVATSSNLNASTIADAVELEILLSKAQSRSIDWIREKSLVSRVVTATRIDAAVSTMQRRHGLLGDSYPLAMKAVGVLKRDSALSTPYAAMLAITSGSPLLTWDQSYTAKSAEAFEHLVVRAMQCLVGTQGRALRFAFPSSIGRPQAFSDAIPWLAGQLGIKEGHAYRPPRRKDGGVDVVAWRPFPDGRTGFPIFLVQATVEGDFAHKTSDVDLRTWAGWLRLDTEPTSVLAVPRTIPPGETWNEVSARAVILDRIRLAGLLPNQMTDADLTPLHAFVQSQKANLRKALDK